MLSEFSEPRGSFLFGELLKLPAFFRRDLLTAWTYRMSFFSDFVALGVSVVMFYFLGRLISPAALPAFGGSRPTYMEFVAIGVVLGLLVAIGIVRVSSAIQGEQLKGTLESLMTTPTSTSTILVGSVLYDLMYVPLRTVGFLIVIAVAFGLDYHASGLLPAAAFLVLFIPFVWGLGFCSAGITLTFRQGAGVFAVGVTLLTLGSGAYFPIALLPDPLPAIAEAANPIAIAANGMRDALLGGAGWEALAPDLLLLAAMSIITLVCGLLVFRLAMRREQRAGSLGLY